MFCPECGSTNKKMIGNICIDCFLKTFKMVKIPENIDITVCSHCNSKLQEGKWSEPNIPKEEIIYRLLERNIKIDENIKNEIINLEIGKITGTIANCVIDVQGEINDKLLKETHDVNVKLKSSVCPNCSKRQSGYYESVVQFRADKRKISDEEYEIANQIVQNKLKKLFSNDKLAYCPQIAELKEGYDYYIGSLKFGRKIANALKEQFGGIIKESARLIGEDKSTGKGIYRIWILIRIPQFNINDFIKFDDKIIQIKDINKNRVIGINIKTNKTQSITWKETEKTDLVKKEEDIEKIPIISKSPDYIQILDPTDYSTVDLELREEFKDLNIGDEVNTIKIEDNIYLLS